MGLASVRLLSAPAADTPGVPPVVLTLDAQRYLFNIGEGTTRTATQRRLGAKKCANLFVSRVGVECTGGLPGFLMTLADAGRHSVTIHGPRGLTHAIATMRLYAKRDTLAVTPREVGQFHLEGDASGENRLAGEQTPIFQDQHVAVYAVPLVPEGYTQDENAALHSRDSEERHSLPGSPSAQAQLKRKRSPTRGAPLDMSKNPWEMRGFQPSALRGADADTWTRATVEGMFNATALTRHEPVAPEGIAQASADPTAAQALRRPHGPAWIASPLPPPPIAPYSASLGAEQEIDGGQPLVLSYICAAHAQRGKFDPARARELGVPPGPDFAKLTRGEVVRVRRAKDPALRAMVLNQSKKGKGKDAAKAKGPKGKGKQTGGKPSENGNAEAAQQSEEPEPEIEMEESDVRPEDVLGATRAGPVFIQVHLPSKAYIPTLLSPAQQRAFTPYTASANAERVPEQRVSPQVIVHAVGPGVLEDERYREWMKIFGDECYHIIANEEYCANKLAYPSSAVIQLRLSKLDPALFRVSGYELEPRKKLSDLPGLPSKTYAASADQIAGLHPRSPPSHFKSGAPDFDFPIGSEQAERLAAFLGTPGSSNVAPPTPVKDSSANANANAKKSTKAERKTGTASQGNNANEEQNAAIASARARAQEGKEKAWEEYKALALQIRQEMEQEEVAMKEKSKALQGQGQDRDVEMVDVSQNGASVASAKRSAREGEGVIVTTLGTGSASPSKYRNVSATLIQTPSDGNVLLDAGESTYGQLKRRFGSSEIDRVIGNLRLVFISHLHADHHMGLSKLLVERRKLHARPSHPLYVVANDYTCRYLREYDAVERLGISDGPNGVIFIDNAHLDWQRGIDPSEPQSGPSSSRTSSDHAKPRRFTSSSSSSSLAALKALTRFTGIRTVEVSHRAAFCYGLVLSHTDGWSLAYSGDSRPCNSLVRAGRNVTLLIHEATIEDDKPEMADAKGHSTFGQAIQVAREMGAKRLLLTHFSQRYPKLPRISAGRAMNGGVAAETGTSEADAAPASEQEQGHEPIVALAFDLVSLPITEMWKMEHYRRAMELLFDADEEEGEGEGEGGGDAPLDEEWDTASIMSGVQSASAAPAPGPGPASRTGAGNSTQAANSREAKGRKEEKEQVPVPPGQSDGPTNAAGIDSNGANDSNGLDPQQRKFVPQRRNVTDMEHRYVFLQLTAPTSPSSPASSPPSQLSIQQAVQKALLDMHGVVGSAIAVDILHVGRPSQSQPLSRTEAESGDEPADRKETAEAVLRVGTDHLETLLSALSGSTGNIMTFEGGKKMRASVRTTTAVLPHVIADSRAWTARLLRGD